MSAVAGIVHLDGGQAAPRDLQALCDSLVDWGSSTASATTGDACFAFVGPRQTLLPSACLKDGAIITAHARLDNREELCEWLGLHRTDAASLADGSLIVRAFERWGEACPERLNGDWSLAVWCPGTRRLFLARDHFGNTSLYYARAGHRVAFSSDIRALSALPWLPRTLNETRIASLLIGGNVDEPTSTIYRGISGLPPAHCVTITLGDERLTRYWKLEETPDSGPATSDERAALLRSTLRAAVSSRLEGDGAVGSMLSGGLDSSAVTAFAAEHLSCRHERLTAFTSVPAFPSTNSRSRVECIDEGPRAAEVVQSFDSIDHVLVKGGSTSPIEGIRRGLAIHGEPLMAGPNYFWITELLAEARARGIKRLLTGQVGDFVMAGRPAVPSWSRDLSERNYRAMLKRLAPAALQRLRQVDWQPWRLTEAPWRTYSVINTGFAAETRLAERLQDRLRTPAIERQATSPVGAIWASLGATFGLTVLDPLQDKRVMEHMFSSTRPPAPRGVDRWLFRQSLRGVLPEHVRLNRRKNLQSADIVERLRASWTEVEDALALAEASPLARRCLDLEYCRALAASIRTGEAPRQSRRRAFTLVNGLSAALFLVETGQ